MPLPTRKAPLDEPKVSADPAAPPPVLRERFRSIVRPLLGGLAAVLLLLAFVAIGGAMLEGDTRHFDDFALRQAQALRAANPWLASVMRDLSGLGSMVVLTIFVAITVGYLMVISARQTALLVAVSAGTGVLGVSVFKSVFGRVRPDRAFAELVAPGLSFPSGHATMSATVFLTIAALAVSTRTRWQERVYVLAAAAVLAALVGVSRVALGVHWATDVLAGWAFGSAWAIGWVMLARVLARQRVAMAAAPAAPR